MSGKNCSFSFLPLAWPLLSSVLFWLVFDILADGLLRYLQSFPGSKNGSKVLLSTAVGVSLETSCTSFCGILPNKQYDNWCYTCRYVHVLSYLFSHILYRIVYILSINNWNILYIQYYFLCKLPPESFLYFSAEDSFAFWNTKSFTPSADLWYDKSKRRFHLGHWMAEDSRARFLKTLFLFIQNTPSIPILQRFRTN